VKHSQGIRDSRRAYGERSHLEFGRTMSAVEWHDHTSVTFDAQEHPLASERA